MKKIISLISLLIFTYAVSLSQGVYVSVEGGPSLALGKFAADSDDGAGFAKTGFNGSASVGYRFSDEMSVGIRGIFTQNAVDNSNSVFTDITPWNSTSILAAIKGSYAISDFFSAEAELNTGIMILTYPVGNISIGGINIGQNEREGNGIVLGGGLGALAHITDNFAARLGVHYIGGKPSYTENNRDFSQRIDLLFVNFGIVFEIN